ncbi:MAG: twin-arginine translocase subunit TatC [Deltaproteobacteria bacterium]|nr:twin-arginine translocase subunit TatC [Candidatus Anaeroferrophillus wilburensis]MBN2890022.1 twin-arginine translocase subunit TatC [Deltaproteobacteria bacterium]
MTLTEHLEELRRRLIACFVAVGLAFCGTYYFAKDLFQLLMAPLLAVMPPDQGLIFTGLPEAFFTYLKVALVAAFFIAAPVILYEIWKFVAPGLYSEEKKYILPFVFFSTVFFAGGAMFGYYVVFPFGFRFFVGFATDFIRPLPSVKEYFAFATRMLFAFGVVFELPVFSLFLARIGVINAAMLVRQRKYAFLGVFVISAILTPPDVLSQLMMAGPLMILYEISIIVARIFGKKEKADETAGTDDLPETRG